MYKVERQIVEWIDRHLTVIFIVAVSVCGILIRFMFRNFESGDSKAFLLPWWEEINNNGGIRALKYQTGNYNMLYQFLIAVMTYLPIKPLYQYKILSGIFDYLLALGVGFMSYKLTNKDMTKGAVAYAVILMSPLVIFNSAAWAQCDSIYVFFIVLSLILLMDEHYGISFFVLGVAFSFKLQAVFILPFFIFYYFKERKFSIIQFLLIPLAMCVTAIPSLVMGRGIADVFMNYVEQIGTYTSLAINYPSVWCVVNEAVSPETLKAPAVIITVVLIGIFMYIWIKSAENMDKKKMLYCAFILAYTCVLFLPKMHERYGYLYEILAILIAFVDRKTIIPCVILNMVSLITYSSYLYGVSYDARILGCINGLVYLAYVVMLIPSILKKSMQNENT